MGISLDNPDITQKNKCRYYACVAVDDRAEAAGEVGVMGVRPGRYAVGRSGRRGSCPPRLPQIRTCGFPASGSSAYGLAAKR